MVGLMLHKNAGGKTPALGGPSLGGNQLLYSMRLGGFQIAHAEWNRSMRLD